MKNLHAKDFLSEILRDEKFVSEFWIRAKKLKKETILERDYQRIFTALIRENYSKSAYVEFCGDIPTANSSTGYDLAIYLDGLTYFIEAKTDKAPRLRPSQIQRLTEIFGYAYLVYRILIFDGANEIIFMFSSLRAFNDYLAEKSGAKVKKTDLLKRRIKRSEHES